MELISTIPFYEDGAASDIEWREIREQLVDVVEEEAHMLSVLEYMGAVLPTKNKHFYSYKNNFQYKTVTVNDATPPLIDNTAAGVDVTFDSTTHLRKGSVLMTSTRQYLYVVSVTSATVAKVKRLDGDSNYQTTDNEALSVPTNAVGEGSSNGDMDHIDPVLVENQIQIFENGTSASDLQMAGKTVIKFRNGKQYYFYKIMDEAFQKHRMDIANNHLTGTFDQTTDVDGNVVYFSRGLDKWAESEGVDHNVDVAGTIDKDDFSKFNRALDLVRSPKSGALVCGGDINNDIDDLFDTQLASGGVDRGVFGKGSNSRKAVDLGVKTFTVYGRTFDKISLPQMDHPAVTAVQAASAALGRSEFPVLAYFLPAGKIKGTDGTMVPRIAGRYLEFADEQYINGRFHQKLTGGLAPQGATDNDNKLNCRYTSWEALDINGAAQIGRLDQGYA